MTGATIVILAAGEGTRMRSPKPKLLHDLCGRPLVLWPVEAALAAGAERVVVVDGPGRKLAGTLPDGVDVAIQEEPRGTGDAVKAAAGQFGEGPVIVLAGDVPLIGADFLAELAAGHAEAGTAATMATMVLDEPGAYGRVVRDDSGDVERVVEAKGPGDATADQLAIREVNTGVFCFEPGPLRDALATLRSDNAQSEYYLPDVLPALRDAGHRVAAHVTGDSSLTLGVNDRVDLARVRALAQRRIHDQHLRAGVGIVDPATTTIDVAVTIGADATIEPGSILRGTTSVGAGATVGPYATVVDSTVEDGAVVIHSHLTGAHVGPGASVGPFAYLRPGARLERGAKAGTFVEIKNSTLAEGAKVPHLSYVGDADVGEGANVGAGSITANYDGREKHRTTIGARARISVDTAFVAPVTVGEGAYTAAGSVITEDVPPGALGVARQRQTNVEGYADRKAPKER